jgi:hypothetical protein
MSVVAGQFTERIGTLSAHALQATHQAAYAASVFLTPLAVLALALGIWRLIADLGWAEQFAIENGIFSHWQVWIAIAISLKIAAGIVERPSKTAEQSSPRK